MKKYLCAAIMLGATLMVATARPAAALNNTKIDGTTGQQKNVTTSTDDRLIAFISVDNSLVPNDTNNRADAFLKDTVTGTTTRISVSGTGAQADGDTSSVILTGNGRYALITSQADNLASGAATSSSNVYIRDTKLGTTSLVAARSAGQSLSEDARFVYYTTIGVLYAKDMLTGSTTRLDVDATGMAGNGSVTGADSSCDGRLVVFASTSTNLVPGDSNAHPDIFLLDRLGGSPVIKDITIAANDESYSPSITCDGNYVLFKSNATNLDANYSDTNTQPDWYEYDVSNDSFRIVTIDPSGNQYSTITSAAGQIGDIGRQNISMNGRYVVFAVDKGTQTSDGLQHTSGQIFLRDLLSNTTTPLTTLGGNTFADYPTITYDGSKVYYGYAAQYSGPLNTYLATNYL